MDEPKRYTPDYTVGLTKEQVDERIREGFVNADTENKTKSYGQILKEHFFTFYNILNILLAGLLIAVGAYKDLMFVAIVLINFMVGVIQEFASKRTLDKLSLIVAARVAVLRDGKKESVRNNELVLDDVVVLKTGNQVAADSIVLSGYLEVNESLISGESDVVTKREGDFLYSGSFVVSGTAHARVEHIGADNYAHKISTSAKALKKRKSKLYSALNTILRTVSFVIVPVGIMLYYKQNVILGLLPEAAIVKSVAGVIGMIPEGLILMTSIAFVTSVIFLGQDNTLVQDMYGIETMARVDTLCLDKTGTLTEGMLQYEKMVPLRDDVDIAEVLRNFCGASQDENATISAIRLEFPPMQEYAVDAVIPFSSDRKYSGVVFSDHGTYMMGATEFLFRENESLLQQAEEYSEGGKRVLLLAHSKNRPQNQEVPDGLEPVAFLIIADRVRGDAKATLDYFYGFDVDIKIISGDNPKTVAFIAEQAGVRNIEKYIDASLLKTESELQHAILTYNVFGRVSPQQKRDMVRIMKDNGKKVAMMGDGVNDVLALKEANCSVAVASGSDAAKNISDIVLMDSNLEHLLHVVEDGRKIINNIQRVATLFITKTVYSLLLALATLFLFESAYPFTPLQMTFTSFVTIGAPAFFLALEPQYARVEGHFLRNVLQKSLPGGLCIMLSIIFVNMLKGVLSIQPDQLSTMCVYLVVAGGMWVLLKVSRPLTLLRRILFFSMIGLFTVSAIFFHDFFEIYEITWQQWVAVGIISAAMFYIMRLMEWLMQKFYNMMDDIAWRNKKVKLRIYSRKDDYDDD